MYVLTRDLSCVVHLISPSGQCNSLPFPAPPLFPFSTSILSPLPLLLPPCTTPWLPHYHQAISNSLRLREVLAAAPVRFGTLIAIRLFPAAMNHLHLDRLPTDKTVTTCEKTIILLLMKFCIFDSRYPFLTIEERKINTRN